MTTRDDDFVDLVELIINFQDEQKQKEEIKSEARRLVHGVDVVILSALVGVLTVILAINLL